MLSLLAGTRVGRWLTGAVAILAFIVGARLQGRREGAQRANQVAEDRDQNDAIKKQAKLIDAISNPVTDPERVQREFDRALEKHKRNLRGGG